jgi:hypothetical protein
VGYSQSFIKSKATQNTSNYELTSMIVAEGGWFERENGLITNETIDKLLAMSHKAYPHLYTHILWTSLPETSMELLEMDLCKYRE